MGQLRTRRQLLLASLAAVPLLVGCTVSGSKEQQRLEQQATPTASPTQGPIFTPTAQVTPTGLPTPLSTATPGSTATLRFGVTGNSVLTNIYQQLSPTFSKRNPHLTVKTEPLPSNGLEGIKAALAANTAPDVLLLSWDQLSPLATLGGLDDLTALLGAGFLNTSGL
ncbi:MAG: extracellular solute-binding protein, partial [Chloroflexi bacterium]|nr:extracellular solute-binding protein [Chloroflexota bacterium]